MSAPRLDGDWPRIVPHETCLGAWPDVSEEAAGRAKGFDWLALMIFLAIGWFVGSLVGALVFLITSAVWWLF